MEQSIYCLSHLLSEFLLNFSNLSFRRTNIRYFLFVDDEEYNDYNDEYEGNEDAIDNQKQTQSESALFLITKRL